MKNKLIKTFSIIFITAACVFALWGCSGGSWKYDYLVTFDYNIESVGVTGNYENQYLGVDKDSVIMHPVKVTNGAYTNSKFKEHQIPRYDINGWWLAKTDENGEPQKDEDGNIEFDRKWDFKTDKVNSNITLYAELVKQSIITLIYDGKVQLEKSISVGSEIISQTISTRAPSLPDKTFYGYFLDAEYTIPCSFPFIIGDEDVPIYAKFIDGANFKIVKTAQEFYDNLTGSTKIYVDADIDFTGFKYDKCKLLFNSEIAGNGHTISNITATVDTVRNNADFLGLFGRLGSQTYIHDISFENINLTVSAFENQPCAAALLAWQISDGARLENLTLTGSISNERSDPKNAISLFVLATNNLENVSIINVDYSKVDVIHI